MRMQKAGEQRGSGLGARVGSQQGTVQEQRAICSDWFIREKRVSEQLNMVTSE